jgi:PDZ domain
MTEFSAKAKMIILIDIFLFITCILGIYHVFLKAGLEPTAHVNFEQKDHTLTVMEVVDKQFKGVIRPGDVLVAINGQQITRKEDIEFILDGFAIGDTVRFTFSRNNIAIDQDIKLPAYYEWIYIISQIIVGCAFFILAVFVIYKRPALLTAHVWHWSSIGGALIIMCTWGRYTSSPYGLGHVIRIIFCIAYAFVPTLFLHLSFVFPKTKYLNINKWFYPLYGLSVVLAVWMTITFLFTLGDAQMVWFHRFMLAFDFNRFYFSGVILFGMANIIHSYFIAKEETEKRKIRWVWPLGHRPLLSSGKFRSYLVMMHLYPSISLLFL